MEQLRVEPTGENFQLGRVKSALDPAFSIFLRVHENGIELSIKPMHVTPGHAFEKTVFGQDSDVLCKIGGKLSFCSSYSGNSNSPIGLKFLIGMSSILRSLREVMTINSFPATAPAAVILRMVVATPLTSSSVSVNQARLLFCKASGIFPVNSWKIRCSHLRDGAWL